MDPIIAGERAIELVGERAGVTLDRRHVRVAAELRRDAMRELQERCVLDPHAGVITPNRECIEDVSMQPFSGDQELARDRELGHASTARALALARPESIDPEYFHVRAEKLPLRAA